MIFRPMQAIFREINLNQNLKMKVILRMLNLRNNLIENLLRVSLKQRRQHHLTNKTLLNQIRMQVNQAGQRETLP